MAVAAAPSKPGKKKTVLIVEDEQGIRSAVAEALELHGYEVIPAVNGQDAINALQTHQLPDLILLDLNMPVKDGYTFRLEQTGHPHWSNIPVVTITADTDFIGRLERAGCTAYLQKPFELDDLLAMVEKYCDLRSVV